MDPVAPEVGLTVTVPAVGVPEHATGTLQVTVPTKPVPVTLISDVKSTVKAPEASVDVKLPGADVPLKPEPE